MSKQTMNDVLERQSDIERLEKNIQELHQMFLDMAELVNEQGQTIDNIEFNVNQTRDYIQETRKELPKAVDLKRAARRVISFQLLLLLLSSTKVQLINSPELLILLLITLNYFYLFITYIM